MDKQRRQVSRRWRLHGKPICALSTGSGLRRDLREAQRAIVDDSATEVLLSRQTLRALAAGLVEPGKAGRLPAPEAFPGVRTELIDRADDLVTGDERAFLQRQLALDLVQIGAADAAGAHANPHLSGCGNRVGEFPVLQGRRLCRRGALEDHRKHEVPPWTAPIEPPAQRGCQRDPRPLRARRIRWFRISRRSTIVVPPVGNIPGAGRETSEVWENQACHAQIDRGRPSRGGAFRGRRTSGWRRGWLG